MTNKQMDFSSYSVCKPDYDWFESSCRLWVEHYNFMLGLPWISTDEEAWYKEQICINKLYDV